MGVTKLWDLLSSVCHKDLPLSSLNGTTLAVDLSQWICELKKIEIAQKIPNLYLRNLFFRATNLMKHGIRLIFIEDGTAPEIKKAVMAERNNYRGVSLERSGMKKTYQKCRELLSLLGLPCVQSVGEAEKLCARLNKSGKVDGVYSADGDVFLYGAQKVYRNLDLKKETIDCCMMEDIKDELFLDRNDLITIALLSGCDYRKGGVQNVGIEKADKFVQHCNKLHLDPLKRVKEWRYNDELVKLQKVKDSPLKKLPHCSTCKHLGTKPEHIKCGCNPCDTVQSCDSRNHVICSCECCTVESNKFELSMREKALKNPEFPDQKIIDEFLTDDSSLPDLHWDTVNVTGLQSFLKDNLKWKDLEFFNKITPILVSLQLNGMDWAVSDKLIPEKIIRRTKQKPSGVVVYWKKLDIDDVTEEYREVTVAESSFRQHYPEMLAEFDKSQDKQKGKKRKVVDSKGQKTLKDLFPVVKKVKLLPSSDWKK